MFYTEILTRKVELWITRFTCEKTPQHNFSSQNFSVENNYLSELHYFSILDQCVFIYEGLK